MTETIPSYPGCPTFKVGDTVRNLHMYGGAEKKSYGKIVAIRGPYEVEIRTMWGRTRWLTVGEIMPV